MTLRHILNEPDREATMRQLKLKSRQGVLAAAAILGALTFSACDFDVPITTSPTRGVQASLLGDWVAKDGKDTIKVRQLDDFSYIVSYNGYLLRAYHSDVDGVEFVSVQDIDSTERKYCYRTWKLSADGQSLTLKAVNFNVVPKTSKEPAKLLRQNVRNPELLEDETQFSKTK